MRAKISWSPDSGWSGVTSEDIERWQQAYPACKITRQLAAAGEWLRANPKRAVKRNWRAFFTNWLSRSQDRGGDERAENGQDRGGRHPAGAGATRPEKGAREYAEQIKLPIAQLAPERGAGAAP